MTHAIFKVGDGTEVLNVVFSVGDLKNFIVNAEIAIRPKESGGLGRTGDICISVMGSSVSFDDSCVP